MERPKGRQVGDMRVDLDPGGETGVRDTYVQGGPGGCVVAVRRLPGGRGSRVRRGAGLQAAE